MTLEEAINYYGTGYKLAKALHITPQALVDWKQKNAVPVVQQYRLERITDGKLKCSDPILKKILREKRKTEKQAKDLQNVAKTNE